MYDSETYHSGRFRWVVTFCLSCGALLVVFISGALSSFFIIYLEYYRDFYNDFNVIRYATHYFIICRFTFICITAYITFVMWDLFYGKRTKSLIFVEMFNKTTYHIF